jgi:hypothetical protein
VGSEKGAREAEAEGGWGDRGCGAVGVVGGSGWVGGGLEPGKGGRIMRRVGEVVRLEVREERRRGWVKVGHGQLSPRRRREVDGTSGRFGGGK